MPVKRKTKRKPPKRSKSQSQSQRQSVIVNVGKTTPAKKKRSGRGGLPPPSYQQNLFPPTIIQQQAPNIAVLENQISRLTSMIQEPIGIKQPATPLSADTKAKTAEAQRLAGEQAEARRPGPTAGNFQAPPSLTRNTLADQTIDAFGNPLLDISSRRSPEPFRQTQQQIIDIIVAKADSDRKAREFPTLKELAVRELTRQFSTEGVNRVRPPDPVFSDRLVNPADPPKMTGLGEGSGGLPVADARRAPPGRPAKGTQQAIPVSPPTGVQADGTPITKKETKAQKTKREKEEAQARGQKTIKDFI